jgi:hypothetical protein
MADVQHSTLAGTDLHAQVKYYQSAEPSAEGEAEGDLWWNSGDDTLHYYDGADWVALAAEAAGGGNALPFNKAGRYYDAAVVQQVSNATAALAANTLYANLVYAQAKSDGGDPTFDRIMVNVTGAGAGGTDARLGVYAMGADGFPGALVLDAGTVDVDSTGVKEVTGLTLTLTAGRFYYTAVVSDGAPTVTSYSSMQQAVFGWASAANTAFENRWSVAHTYGALPNPFGTPTGSGNGLAFRVALRAS